MHAHAPPCAGRACSPGLWLTAGGLCMHAPPSVTEALRHVAPLFRADPLPDHHSRHLADAACGGELEDCCAGGTCDRDDLACVTALCVPCGAAYDPACDAPGVPLCNDGLVFRPDGRLCRNPNPPPPPCGDEIELCCPGDVCNSPDLSCGDYGLCEPCGGAYSQPCTDPSVPPCNGPLVLDDYGFCTQDFSAPPGAPCGAEFGVCCDDGSCSDAGAVCVEGRCYACGTRGQPACGADYAETVVPQCFFFLEPDGDLTCVERPCGGVTELCCNRTDCNGSLVCYELLCRPCGTPGQAACDYTEDDFVDEPGVNEPFCFDFLYQDNDGVCQVAEPGQLFGTCLDGGRCEGESDCYLADPDGTGGVCLVYEQSACGYDYAPCCGRTCESGLGCNDNSCSPCGAEGFPACSSVGGFQCAPGLFVGGGGICSGPPLPPPPPLPAPDAPAPPPPVPPKPTRSPKGLPPGFGTFPAVRECGARLGPCCPGDRPSCSEDGLTCVGALCVPCGGRLERACVDDAGEKSCGEGLEVVAGACVPTGPRTAGTHPGHNGNARGFTPLDNTQSE